MRVWEDSEVGMARKHRIMGWERESSTNLQPLTRANAGLYVVCGSWHELDSSLEWKTSLGSTLFHFDVHKSIHATKVSWPRPECCGVARCKTCGGVVRLACDECMDFQFIRLHELHIWSWRHQSSLKWVERSWPAAALAGAGHKCHCTMCRGAAILPLSHNLHMFSRGLSAARNRCSWKFPRKTCGSKHQLPARRPSWTTQMTLLRAWALELWTQFWTSGTAQLVYLDDFTQAAIEALGLLRHCGTCTKHDQLWEVYLRKAVLRCSTRWLFVIDVPL